MNKDNINVAVTIVCGAAYLYFLYRLHQASTTNQLDFPTREEMIEAIENGASHLTVTPVVQSDN